MQFPTIATLLLLPVLATASTSSMTTTLTSTQTQTRTITVSQVIASVTSTYPVNNTTTVGPTAYPTAPSVYPTAPTVIPSGTGATITPTETISPPFSGASSLNSMYAGSAFVVMIAAALL